MNRVLRILAVLVCAILSGCGREHHPVPFVVSEERRAAAVFTTRWSKVSADCDCHISHIERDYDDDAIEYPQRGITDGDLALLQQCRSLVSLDLTNARVTAQGLSVLESLQKLEYLTIDGQSDATFMQLRNSHRLKSLYCSNCWVDDDGFASLGGLDELEVLGFLNESRITAHSLAKLPTLPALKVLLLPNGNVGDDDLEPILRQPALERVEFKETRISETGLRKLLRIPGIRRIRLRSVSGKNDVLDDIKREHSHVDILLRGDVGPGRPTRDPIESSLASGTQRP